VKKIGHGSRHVFFVGKASRKQRVVVELDEEEALRVDAAVDDLGQVPGVPEAPPK
jgi:hypothetical protein